MRGVSGPSGHAGGLVDDRPAVKQWVVLSQDGPSTRVAAGMRQLQTDKQIIVAGARLAMSRAGLAQQPLDGAGVGRTHQELTRVGPSLGDDGTRLAPDQLGPAGAEAAKAAERELARRAVERGIATFHWLDREPVADEATAHVDGAEKRREIVAQANIKTERMSVCKQSLACLVLEVARHAYSPSTSSVQTSADRSARVAMVAGETAIGKSNAPGSSPGRPDILRNTIFPDHGIFSTRGIKPGLSGLMV